MSISKSLLGLKTYKDVAAFFQLTPTQLLTLLYKRRPEYRTFQVPKRSGELRNIRVPPDPIRRMQNKILQALLPLHVPKATCHGFARKRSIVTNAAGHAGSDIVVNIDLKDFFPSITHKRVAGVFRKPPLSLPHAPAAILADICCVDNQLPQGAPTSPILSNFVCRRLDLNLSTLAKRTGCRYSRYADDLTFSAVDRSMSGAILQRPLAGEVTIGDVLRKAIKDEGFEINPAKLRAMSSLVRQTVTGLVVNQNVRPSRIFISEIRGALHNWEFQTYRKANREFRSSYSRRSRAGKAGHLREYLRGKLAFVKQVCGPDSPSYAEYACQFCRLTGSRTTVRGRAALTERILRQTLFIVAGVDALGDPLVFGTAFHLDRIGFVTCQHVLDLINNNKPMVSKAVLFRADKPAIQHQFKVRKSDSALDLAILDSAIPVHASLTPTSPMGGGVGTQVLLAGYSLWRPGAPLRVEPGKVVSVRTFNGRELIQVSCDIYDGNSGGPLLGPDGGVVGVAALGFTGVPLPKSCVAVSHVLAL